MYDALTMWDLLSADKPSVVIPGLATEWKVDEADKKKWTFKLRPGVTFHDGSPLNADAVVWNVEKVLKQDAPQFDASQVGVTASRMPTLARDIVRSPIHPYPKGLLASTVHGARRGARLETIPGTPPALDRLPDSCSFAPRCSFAQPRCTEQLPSNVTIASGHTARCVLAGSAEIPAAS